jgi:CheY-like chemotaxis protein
MDVQMPVMSGLAATRAIRQMSGRAHTPILAMTANAFEEDRRNCLDAGMNDFLSKPVDPETLYAMLIKWLPRTDGTLPDQLVTAQVEELNEMAESEFDSGLDSGSDSKSEPDSPVGERVSLKRRLAGVPGLDVENGLLRVRGNEDKFEQVVELFRRGHDLDAEKLDAALVAGDLTAVEQLAHALKGSAGLVGALQVAELATALLNEIRAKAGREVIDAAYAALRQPLLSLIDGLNSVQADEAIDTLAPDTERGRQVLSRLLRLLEDGDMEAVIFAREESVLLRHTLGESSQAILHSIQGFDYAQALAELRALEGQRALVE